MRRKPIEKDNGWAKTLATGEKILGLDRDVAIGNASWSKTRLLGMVGCEVRHDGVCIELNGIGNYWQSDDLEVVYKNVSGTTAPFFITRRICKQIEPTDKFMIVCEPTRHKMIIHVTSEDPHLHPSYTNGSVKDIQAFTPEDIGKWLFMEIDAQALKRSWRMSEVRC